MMKKKAYSDVDWAIAAGVHPNTLVRYKKKADMVNQDSRSAIEKAKKKLDAISKKVK